MIKNIYFFIGTEAELIKVMPVMRELSQRKIKFKIIASGQNNITNSDLLKFLNMKKVDIILHNKKIKISFVSLFFWFIKTLIKGLIALRKEFRNLNKNKTFIIVHGDTISTVMGAIIGKFYRLKVIHTEAGYRSFNFFRPFPEEIDRVLVSYLADIHFCPHESAINNIKKRRGVKINTFYNTIIDSLSFALSQNIKSSLLECLANKKYFIFILHRQENIFNKSLVRMLIELILNFTNKFVCVLVMHEPTRVTLEKWGVLNKLKQNPNVVVSLRLPYIEFIKLLSNCEFILTDGGSNQQETFYLGKPCLILRKIIEGTEGVNKNMVLSKNNPEIIKSFILRYKEYIKPAVTPDVRPSKIIVNYLVNN